MTRDAPVRVAECPPLGDGGTPSICGKAHSHCLSTIFKTKCDQRSYFLNFDDYR